MRIVKSTTTLQDLESQANAAEGEGFTPVGAPFRDIATGSWVQSMWKPSTPEVSEVRIREQKAGKR